MSDYLKPLPRIAEGDVLRVEHINAPTDALMTLQIQPGSGPGAVGVSQSPAGTAIIPPKPPPVEWARIIAKSSSSSPTYYGWRQVLPAANGKWTDGPMHGPASSTPGMFGALEVNGNTNVTVGTDGNAASGGSSPSSGGVIVEMRFLDACGCWSFQYGACSTSSS